MAVRARRISLYLFLWVERRWGWGFWVGIEAVGQGDTREFEGRVVSRFLARAALTGGQRPDLVRGDVQAQTTYIHPAPCILHPSPPYTLRLARVSLAFFIDDGMNACTGMEKKPNKSTHIVQICTRLEWHMEGIFDASAAPELSTRTRRSFLVYSSSKPLNPSL